MSVLDSVEVTTINPQTDDPIMVKWLETRRAALLMELRFIEYALGMERTKTARELRKETREQNE
jgi:hypothetical protein